MRQREALLSWWLITSAALGAPATPEEFPVAVFPGAFPQPEIARAMEDYYRPGIAKAQSIKVEVYATTADFQKVHDFYAPRVTAGKWDWRRKQKVLLQVSETLKFLRAQAISQSGKGRLPDNLKPLFGDPKLSQEQFDRRLDQLVKDNKDAKITMAEGSRRVGSTPASGTVRIQLESPYLDVDNWRLTDETRIVLIKVSEAGAPIDEEKRQPAAARNGTKKEAKSSSPVRIKGLGEEAFWVSDAVAGALYVLKGDAYFRLSIGGWADQSQRLGKTKRLARYILKRL